MWKVINVHNALLHDNDVVIVVIPPTAQSVYLKPQLQPFCLAQCHQLSPLQCQRWDRRSADSLYIVTHCRLLADISIQSDSRGGSRQRFSWTHQTQGLNLLTFQWHDVLSNHRSILSGEVRWQLHIWRGGDGKKQWGERVEWKVRDWKIERIQNELRWKMKWAETWRQMLLKETWSQWKCKRE